MPIVLEDQIWAGSETSLQAALHAVEASFNQMKAGVIHDPQEEDLPRLLQKQDGVGVVSITGPLVNSDSPYLKYFGVTGYPEIRDALVNAATDPQIGQILLHIDSGGGAVSGVADTADLIRKIHTDVKPVTAFTDGTMASAAYWLGSSAGSVYSGKMAMVGSIGVIATHMERSKQLKEAGIGVTVVRSGPYKALANGVEPLSAEGQKQLQANVDAVDQVFATHVADMRKKPYDYVQGTMAQGREFVSSEAFKVGLIDGVTTFDTLFSELKAKSIDGSKNSMDTHGRKGGGFGASTEITETTMAKKPLTDQEIAALAAGAALQAAAPEGETPAPQAETQLEGESAPAAQTEEPVKVDAAVALLKEQLAAAQSELLAAKLENGKLADKVEALSAQVEPMKSIVATAINNMRVALGGSPLDMTASNAESLVAEHGQMAAQFKEKFKAGGVAAVDAAQDEAKQPALSAFAQACLTAVNRKQK